MNLTRAPKNGTAEELREPYAAYAIIGDTPSGFTVFPELSDIAPSGLRAPSPVPSFIYQLPLAIF